MADESRISHNIVRSLASTMNLDLPDNRLDQLVTTLSAFQDNLDRLRQIDAGDSEPPAITYESEVAR